MHLCGCLEGGWGCTHSPVLHAGVCTCTRRWSRGSLQVYIFLREFLWRMCMPAGVYTWPVYVCERVQWCMNACPAVCEFVCVITSACHYGEVYVRERAHNKNLPLAHKNPRTAFPPVPLRSLYCLYFYLAFPCFRLSFLPPIRPFVCIPSSEVLCSTCKFRTPR